MLQSPASKKRLFCFEFERSTSDSRGSEKRCKFAHTVPAVRQTADERETEDMQNARLSMVAVIGYLWAHPDECQSAEKWCVKRAEANRHRVDSSVCFISVSRFGVLCVDWRAQYLVGCSRLQLATIEGANNKDHETIEQIFQYNGMHGSLRLSMAQNVKPVMKACCDAVFSSNGDRITACDTQIFDPETKLVYWDRFGVYSFNFGTDGIAETITHRPSGHTTAIGKRTPIDEEFIMKKKWSDMEAFVVYEDTVHVISKCFKGTAGPKMSEVYQGACKEWDDLWDDKQADHTRQCGVLKAGSSNVLPGQKKFGQEAKEQAACSRLATAMSNMTDKKKQLDATMSVQLIKSVKKQKDVEAKKEAEAAAAAEKEAAAKASNDAGEECVSAVPDLLQQVMRCRGML